MSVVSHGIIHTSFLFNVLLQCAQLISSVFLLPEIRKHRLHVFTEDAVEFVESVRPGLQPCKRQDPADCVESEDLRRCLLCCLRAGSDLQSASVIMPADHSIIILHQILNVLDLFRFRHIQDLRTGIRHQSVRDVF